MTSFEMTNEQIREHLLKAGMIELNQILIESNSVKKNACLRYEGKTNNLSDKNQ